MIVHYSHSEKYLDTDNKEKTRGTKLLKVHVQQVTDKALQLLADANHLNFSLKINELEDLLREIGAYHDLGKYTFHFQNYLLNKTGQFDTELKQHAKFGAFTLFQKLLKANQIKGAALAFFIVERHHANLKEFWLMESLAEKNGSQHRVFEKQKKALTTEDWTAMQSEMSEPNLLEFTQFPEDDDLRDSIESVDDEKSIGNYFLINYLFSLLIEADKLDASETDIYQRRPIAPDAVDKRFLNSTHGLRTRVRHEVVSKLNDKKILNERIFTLTAPTGVGKTLTALDFALKLKNQVPELATAQIIYALPFINIIEQGLEEYEKTLNAEKLPNTEGVKILGHYQYADIFGEKETDADFEKGYRQKAMETDTWQGDIVITSFVQFFQTLIGYRNKLLKKFSHLAGSIIILDEVQTLRLEQLPLIGAALHYLTHFLNARVILMTATKPKIMDLAFDFILEKEGVKKYEITELLHSNKDIYEGYKRTKIVPLLNYKFESDNLEQEFIDNIFVPKWKKGKSCLIVVNKVTRSIELFKMMKKRFYTEESPVYCLSTNLTPFDRKKRIDQIKTDFDNGLKPIVVSTQLIEAGVDLSFEMAFRDLSPIDSIVQVAGRVNRHAPDPQNPEHAHLPVYITDFGDCKKIYGDITQMQASKALEKQMVFLESEYLILVDAYFDVMAKKGSFEKATKIFEAMKTLKYDGDKPNEVYVSSFEIIEKQGNVVSIYVDLPEGRAALTAFRKLKTYMSDLERKKLKQAFDAEHKRLFNQHIIAVPKYAIEGNEAIDNEKTMLADRLYFAPESEYDYEIGLLRNQLKPKEQKELSLSL
jgi:CRISPR-associated endonuclease/helicase Cas3